MKYYRYLIYLLTPILLVHCKKDHGVEWIQRSTLPNMDIYLIPNKYNVMEGDWINVRNFSRFDRETLTRNLRSYGRTLDDLRQNSDLEFREEENVIQMKVGRTAHSTSYEYDTNIPIIFYGPKWFQKGEYREIIHQQHIVPTLAKILKIRNPNGVETSALNSILKVNSTDELPEIIITIVLDQVGQQYYNAHPNTPTNITKIKNEAAYFPNAQVGHIDAETAVGHAAIGTGAYPRKNGITGNGYIKWENGTIARNEIYATEDRLVNPSELLTETIGDVLDNEFNGDSEVISQCYALRASIGMAGHGSAKILDKDYIGDKDIVYWLYSLESRWITDNRYYTFPVEANDYNPLKTFNLEYPDGWEGTNIRNQEDMKKFWGFLMGNPAQVRAEAELFRKVLQNHLISKGKHQDKIPDLAYMTIKATDAAAHQFGYESIQARETFKEADNQIGLILDLLKKEYGDKFILIITADHGGTPLPEISGGERLTLKEFFKEVNSLLPEDAREKKSLIKQMTISQISLDKETMLQYSISEKQIMDRILEIKVKNKTFFKKVYTKSDLQ